MEQPIVYYINLERNVERLRHIEGQLEMAGLRDCAARVPAVDGNELPLSSVPREIVGRRGINHLHDPAGHRHGLDITMGAVGLGMTSNRLWKQIAASLRPAIIFEDDAVLARDFSGKLERILRELPEGWDLVYLGFHPGPGSITLPFSAGLRIPRGQLNGTHGYLVSASGADALIRWCYPMEFQIDTHMYLAFPRLRVFMATRPLVTIARAFGSDIQ